MDEFLEEEKLLIPRHRNPIMFDQNLSSLSPSFHRWVINVKFVATPGRSFDGGTFPRQIGLPPVQSGQSAVMERQRRCSGQNLESLITDPPLLKISDPDTLHTAQCAPYPGGKDYAAICFTVYAAHTQFVVFSVQCI